MHSTRTTAAPLEQAYARGLDDDFLVFALAPVPYALARRKSILETFFVFVY